MLNSILVVGTLTAVYVVLLWWACRTLPGEKWQVLASLPAVKNGQGSWDGVNITYYGFFSATAYAAATALVVFMLGTDGVGPLRTLAVTGPLLAVCIPASRWVAAVVERKPATFTIGGAFFVGLIIAPWLTMLAGKILGPEQGALKVLPVMSSLAIGYAVGEGLGRLACISFGCCYGKPLSECSRFWQGVFRGRTFTFIGATKKVSYEGGLEGQPVLPVQALSSAICVGSGLAGLFLFLEGYFGTALWLVLLVTQGWRAYSETLRRDYRGGGRMSAYQVMALVGIVYGLGAAFFFHQAGDAVRTDVVDGLSRLWNAGVLLSVEGLWLFILMYMGRSRVTGSTISFHLNHSHI